MNIHYDPSTGHCIGSSVHPKWLRLPHCVLLLIPLLLMILLSGCFYGYADFEPAESEAPIILFGRYRLNISGSAEGSHVLLFDASFIHPVLDTFGLDTIPILVIDSACYYGVCLGGDFCARPLSEYEQIEDAHRRGWGRRYTTYPVRDKDLYLRKRSNDSFDRRSEVIPGGFRLDHVSKFPQTCNKFDLCVEIRARLLDRKSGSELSRESKLLQFEIKRGWRLAMS